MDLLKQSAPRPIYEKTAPISIPRDKLTDQFAAQYSLKQNFFDPNQASPPNSWNSRLLQRLGDKTKYTVQANY